MAANRSDKPPPRAKPKPSRVQMFRVKVITMGAQNAGKSALVTRFCTRKFSHKYEATVGVSHAVHGIRLGTAEVRVNFWDLGGAPEFFEIRNEFYKDAQAAVLVFDASNRESFESLDKWRDEALKYGGRDIILLLAATKCDLRTRYVTREEAEQWASQNGCPYFEVSAQSGNQVHQLFATMLARMLPTVPGMPQDAITESIRRINHEVSDNENPPQKPPAAANPTAPEGSRTYTSSYSFSGGSISKEDVKPPAPAFKHANSFSVGVAPPGPVRSGSMRRASQDEVEARVQERKAEWTQQEREREQQEAARAFIRERVKKSLGRIEALTDLSLILKTFGYTCTQTDVKKVFRSAVVELHPDKIAQAGTASMEEAVKKEEMFKILMAKKHLL